MYQPSAVEPSHPQASETTIQRIKNKIINIKNPFKKTEADHDELLHRIHTTDYTRYFQTLQGEIIESYWLTPPFAKALITSLSSSLRYHILEPKLSPQEYLALEDIHRELRDTIILRNIEDLDTREELLFNEFIKAFRKLGYALSIDAAGKLWYYLRRNSTGYDELDPILNDPCIEDISCNGHDIPVYIFHKRHGNMPTDRVYSKDALDSFVLKLSQKASAQLSIEKPLVDASLPNGSRVQITYSSIISTRGSSFTIRKFSDEPITPLDLVRWNNASFEIMGFLWMAVETGKNMLIIGSTASGKTTMLNAISLFIPSSAKIVSLEDTREMQLPHENWLPLRTKEAGRSRVEMFDLLKSALRQRPEYILVGEIRGKEAVALFQAMNTGHITYSTLHAGSVESALNRLLHEPINIPLPMFESLDLIMVLGMHYLKGKSVRRMNALYEIEVRGSTLTHNIIFGWDRKEDIFKKTPSDINIIKNIGELYGMDTAETLEEIEKRGDYLKSLTAGKMSELAERIEEYRRKFHETH